MPSNMTPPLQQRIAAGGFAYDKDVAVVVRFVRFMDDMFGDGKWEHAVGEPETNATLRDGMWYAFKAGAGVK